MTWHEHCAKLEGVLKTTEEENSKLKQEIRGLERELLEANPTVGLQRHLAQALQERDAARREKDGIRNSAVGQINQLRQQLATVQQSQKDAKATEEQTTQKNTLRKLEAVERELEQERQEKQQLQRQLAERDQLLQEDRASPAQPRFSGGKENARLQDLNDRKHDKPCDDSDDSEPEYPSPSPAGAKKPTQPRGNLLAGASKGANFSRGDTSQRASKPTVPSKATPASKSTTTPMPVAKPKLRARKAKQPIDLTASDDEMQQPSSISASSTNTMLPVRTSIHDNITVADHSPPTPSTAASPIHPPPQPRGPLSSKPAPASNSPNKRKHENSQTGSTKRTRSAPKTEEEKLRNEVADLSIDGFGYSSQSTSGPKDRRKSSSTSQDTSNREAEDYATATMDFKFTSICTYHPNDNIDRAYGPGELEGLVEDLWVRLANVKDSIWEGKAGEDWQFDFHKTGAYAAEKYVCVTRKCLKKSTNWGKGRQPGMWACKSCVEAGLPCFTYEGHGRFFLLPLHEKDRKLPVVKDKEVRWWINEEWVPVESDDEMEL